VKIKIFGGQIDCPLSEKLLLDKFADELAELSDVAEKVASQLSVYRFKRSI
jgi:uncharacterized protein Yka (UPF0111/DUF47 family)